MGKGNGSKHGIFFNGKPDKEFRPGHEKNKNIPAFNPPKKKGPTGRYRHDPWPFKQRKNVLIHAGNPG